MADGPLRVGDVLDGFCGGDFGRDSYGSKVVEAIGADWVVAREDGHPVMAYCNPDELTEYICRPGGSGPEQATPRDPLEAGVTINGISVDGSWLSTGTRRVDQDHVVVAVDPDGTLRI